MDLTELELYERTRREHGLQVAEDANFVLSYRNVEKHGIQRAWTIAVRTVLEQERFHDHGTGSVRRAYRPVTV